MKSLIPISSRLVEIERDIQESGGIITPEQEAEIEAIIAADLAQAGRTIVSLDHRRAQLDALIKQAKATSDYWELRAGMYRDAMSRLMCEHANGDGKFYVEDQSFKAHLATQKGRVEIFDEASVPRIFWSREIVEKPDTKLIRAALESGQEVPGARLEGAGEKRVVIKANKDALLQQEIRQALE